MKILINITHPAHLHLFKNTIWNLEKDGHEVKITAKDKDIVLKLLEGYRFDYELIGKNRAGLLNKAHELIKNDLKLFKIAKKFRPDIFVSHATIAVAHVNTIMRKPAITFSDTENARLIGKLTFPFSDVICTPSCYTRDLGPKQVRYDGYHELAYLHPNYFKPDPTILDEQGVSKGEKFIVVRLISWGASHDIGDIGFGNVSDGVKSLEPYGKILITSEAQLPSKFEKYKVTISPEKIHHLLNYANLYIGESATMASESAMLGTPSIFVSSSRRGYTDELESKYGLVYNFSDPKNMQKHAIEKAFELLENKNLKKDWKGRRKNMLREKIDVTKFITNFIENYPESFYGYDQSEAK